MDFLTAAFDLFLHVDRHLVEFAGTYGLWIYALLFLIIFFETGVVVTPFLPGDSLLFATGALAATGAIDVTAVLLLLTAAAVIGDNTNYFIGRAIGPRVFTERHTRFLKREHMLRTQSFYDKHGGKAVVLARFVPIVRTFAPFVAGVGRMHYPRFLAFDAGGGILWVWSFGLLGYFFGSQPIIKENFGLAVVAVVGISVLPIVIEVFKARFRRSASTP
ncbi:MAG: DedA family protein [Gammaproteobacteria bacterium]